MLLISGQGKRAIEDHLDRDGGRNHEKHQPWMDLRFFHARQSVPRGLADAVAIGEPFAGGQPVVVALGDSILISQARKPVLARMMTAHAKHRPAATIAVEAVPHEAVSRYGIVAPKGSPDSVFPIRGFVEKPSPSKAPSNLAAAGRYILEPVIFDAIRRTKPGIGGEIWLTDALQLLLREGHEILCVRLGRGEHRLDIGNFLSYYQAFIEMSLLDPDHGAALRTWLRKQLRPKEKAK